jgi:mono/diheme cytochrome c family protein
MIAPMTAITTAIMTGATIAAADVLEREKCSSCHLLAPPAPEARTLEAYRERKGPDLFYAGSKYRADWLRRWLREPERIRPAGLDPSRHVETVDGQDQLEAEKLAAHPRIPARKIEAIVEALGKLDWGRELLPQTVPAAPAVPRMLAEMNFVKFKGCASCHRISPDSGGLSGPQLYGAADRLRPEFIASYIADPQAWDPVAPMPGYQLPEVEVGKLIHFLRLLDEERDDAATP